MAVINKSSETRPLVTNTGTTNAGTWTTVQCSEWARYAAGVNNTTAPIALRYPAVADGTAYSAADGQQVIPPGASWMLPFSPGQGGGKISDPNFSVRTDVAKNFHFTQGA